MNAPFCEVCVFCACELTGAHLCGNGKDSCFGVVTGNHAINCPNWYCTKCRHSDKTTKGEQQ